MKDDIVFPKDEKAISVVRSYKEHFEMIKRQDEIDFYSSIYEKLLSEEPISYSDVLFLIRVTSSKVRGFTQGNELVTSAFSYLSNDDAETYLEHGGEFKKDASYLIGFLVAHSLALEL